MNSGREKRLLHGILQGLARRELGNLLRFDLDFFTRLGVASVRAARLATLNVPNPAMATVPPFFNAFKMATKTALTAPTASFFVQVTFSTSLISSALFMHAPAFLFNPLIRTWVSINSNSVKYQGNGCVRRIFQGGVGMMEMSLPFFLLIF